MYKIIHALLILFFLVFLNACTKDANVKLPVVESKLVINSFISPQDTVIKVEVTLSQPLYNNSNSGQYLKISNATVQIGDGAITKMLAYNSIDNNYTVSASQLSVVVGKTYTLTISTPDGKNVNASTSIPVSNSTLTYSSQILNKPNQPDSYSIEAKWFDSPGTDDYYRIAFYDKQFYSGGTDTTYSVVYSEVFSDKDNDGKTFNQNFEVYMNGGAGEGELYLIHATKEYYLFHQKLSLAGNGENPFAEAVQMYSNINGGYGIFAGFNQFKLQVIL